MEGVSIIIIITIIIADAVITLMFTWTRSTIRRFRAVTVHQTSAFEIVGLAVFIYNIQLESSQGRVGKSYLSIAWLTIDRDGSASESR